MVRSLADRTFQLSVTLVSVPNARTQQAPVVYVTQLALTVARSDEVFARVLSADPAHGVVVLDEHPRSKHLSPGSHSSRPPKRTLQTQCSVPSASTDHAIGSHPHTNSFAHILSHTD